MTARSHPFGPAVAEILPGVQTHGYAVKTFRKPSVDSHWHFHPELELTLIEAGKGVFHAGRSLTPYAPGDLLLLGANLPHAFGSRPSERTGACWTVMHFAPERWGNAYWQLPQNQRVKALFQQARRGLRFRGREAGRCAELLGTLAKSPLDGVGLVVWTELVERLARIKNRSYLNASPAPEQKPIDPRVRKVFAWIDDEVEFPGLTQAAAAELIGLSPQAFCRFFRQHTGRPFHRYVNELRIAHACSALLNSESSVSEISFHAGFNNLANFNRRFREILGQTPTEYRRSGGGF